MSATHTLRGTFLLALTLLILATVLVIAMPTDWMVAGYVQGRFTQDSGPLTVYTPGTLPQPLQAGMFTTPDNTFNVRRAYLVVHAKVDEHVGAQITTCLDWGTGPYLIGTGGLGVTQHCLNAPNTTVRPMILEAYGEYIYDDYQVRLGESHIPFGYEVPLSSSKLITTERSQVMETQLFPFAFDRGLFAYYLPSKYFNVSAAVVNGVPLDDANTFFDSVNTDKKNAMGRIGVLIPGGTVGVSYYDGHNPYAPSLNFQYLGVDVEDKYGPFTVIAEGLRGNDGGGTNVNVYDFPTAGNLPNGTATIPDTRPEGAYVTLAFQKPHSAAQPYFRYDIYTPDRESTDCYFHRDTVGVNYFLNPTSKVQLEYQAINDQENPREKGVAVLQYQVIF